jgi:cyclic 2,3-diphosphoglycerate synthase
VSTLVLIDGEHYPPVVRAAIAELRAVGHDIVGAAQLGGTEKLPAGTTVDYGLETVTGSDPLGAVLAGLDRFTPSEVFDLSDDPIVDGDTRLLLAAHILVRGATYRGADFILTPPPRPRLATKPTLAVIGTGKRAGKTAIAAAIARALRDDARPPVIVAMGRGGPAEPELVDPTTADLSPAGLVDLARHGRHAASDHLEDALTARVATIGTRRCGGGLAGAPASSTFAAGVALANTRPERSILFEGSGAAVPPAGADATVCVVSQAGGGGLSGLGAYRVLLSDLVVITLAHEPQPASLEARIRGVAPGVRVISTELSPWPLAPVSERSVFFATTAPEPAAARMAAQLGSLHHANVVGWTSHLADRTRLGEDLDRLAGRAEVLVTELKAAAVDVAGRWALERGMEVVYCENRPTTTGDAPPFEVIALEVADLAEQRYEQRQA